MIKVNHFTKQTLQKQYTTISDLVMKTMTEVSLQSDNKTLSQSAKASLSKLDKIRLELDNNKSQDSGMMPWQRHWLIMPSNQVTC